MCCVDLEICLLSLDACGNAWHTAGTQHRLVYLYMGATGVVIYVPLFPVRGQNDIGCTVNASDEIRDLR